MQITANFCVFGYRTREVDLTPALGVGLIIVVFLLVAKTTMVVP